MEHFFELPVQYKGEELIVNGRLVTFGYTYKFYVMIKGEEFVFERDDEQNYRMLGTDDSSGKPLDMELIEAVVAALEKLSES